MRGSCKSIELIVFAVILAKPEVGALGSGYPEDIVFKEYWIPRSSRRMTKTGLSQEAPVFRNSRNGFTLLELLISLVMLGVIALITTSAMRLGIRTVSTGEKKIDRLERTRASFNIIDSQIQSQIPLAYEENGEKKYYFQGDRESLQFSTNYSIWGGRKGYVMVRYKVESDDTGKQLLTASENIIGTNSSRETTLFSAVDAIHFEYFFKYPAEEKGKWVDKWTDTANIPEKVKLYLIYGEKDIPMIIPMRTAGALSQTSSTRARATPVQPAKKGGRGSPESAPKYSHERS